MLRRHRRARTCEQQPVGRLGRERERHVLDERHRFRRGRVTPKDRAVVGDLRTKLSHAPGWVDDPDELAGLRPLADIRIRPPGDLASPDPVGREEGVGERDMHPTQEIGVGRGVGGRPLRRLVGARHLAMQALDACALSIGGSAITEGDDGQPLGRAGQPAERVGLVPRVLHDPCEGPGVEGLHEEGADPANDRREGAVHLPCSRTRSEVADIRAVRH